MAAATVATSVAAAATAAGARRWRGAWVAGAGGVYFPRQTLSLAASLSATRVYCRHSAVYCRHSAVAQKPVNSRADAQADLSSRLEAQSFANTTAGTFARETVREFWGLDAPRGCTTAPQSQL